MDDAFSREVALMVDEITSPKKRSAMLASFAREEIAIAKSQNEAILQRTIQPPRVTVDGKQGAALSTVKPDGVIVSEFNAETNVLRWILRALEQISPQVTGEYKDSHVVYADGLEIVLASNDEPPSAKEYVITSDEPYARKLDPKDGLPARSKQAPKGVYAAVAALAGSRFEAEANVFFTFRDAPVKGGKTMRQPAIAVRPIAASGAP